MAKLTEKQELFVQEYLIDLNATQAAIRAGYKEDNAYSMGAENLKKPQIAERIEEVMNERAARTDITQDRILNELAKIGFAENGRIGDAIVKTADKIKALELLGKHVGMFQDKADASVPVTVVVNYDYGEND